MFPDPEDGMPIEVFELVQLNTSPPPVLALNGTLIVAPGQTVTLLTRLGLGSGFTVIVYVLFGLIHPLLVAVTVIVTITGVAPVLEAVNPGISNGAALSDPLTNPIEDPPDQEKTSPPAVLALNGVVG
jgi:hypothetical protein